MRLRLLCATLVVASISPFLSAQGSAIARQPAVRDALAFLQRVEPETLDEQARICEIPAPPFAESVRAEYYRKRFVELGLQDVRLDAVGNVHGVRPGRTAGPLLVFSAHLDTVFPAGTDTRVKRIGTVLKAPGIADDSRGLAVLLAVVRALDQGKIATAGTVRFVGTVGEEGPGNLRGVRHLFEKELPGKITHFISLDGTGLGTTTTAVGSNRYRVTFRAAGGHSYGQFGLVNPIHALGRALEKIARFEVPEKPKTTFNVGQIGGGTSVNSIARTATMEIDLRSESAEELAKVDAQLHAAIAAAAQEENEFWATRTRNPIARLTNQGTPVTATIESMGRRPTGRVADDAPILQAVRRADAALGLTTTLEAGSTDSNLPISLGLPALTLKSGGDSTGNHALDEQFDSKASHLGTQRAFLALLEIAGLAPPPNP
jgi:acetylornithine deacetylase/succinyl-diaminopimelate desuccinylase-like protein